MAGLLFALTYAWRNLRRGGARSIFAAFCVAVGVAAVVGMQLLALNISAAVDKAPKEANGGDISIAPITTPFQAADLARVADLQRRGIIVSSTITLTGGQDGVKASLGDRTTLIVVRGIQTASYPLYGEFQAETPPVLVKTLLRGPYDAVVTRDLYDRLHMAIGSRVALSSPLQEQVVIRGIVSTGGLFEGDFGIGGTLYQPLTGLAASDPELGSGPHRIIADRLFVRTQDDAHTATALAALKHALGPFFTYTTAADVAQKAVTGTARLQQLLLAAGLLALLIGGIGIVNTMLVAVGRRTREIAVLKTLGLKGFQVVLLFLVEAVVLGIAGSVAGIIGGIGLSLAVTGLAVQLGAQVGWTLRLSPLLVGLALGVVATAVFGFLPVLRAGRTRPMGVLRDDDAPLPRIGWAVTGFVTFLLTGAMGIAAGLALHNLLLGLALAYGIVLLFLIFSGIFLGVVTLASRGPNFGRVSLQLALRNLTRQKRRAASTLVALCIGMLAVGTVVVLAQNVRDDLNRLFERSFGFNVAAFGPADDAPVIAEVRRLPGLESIERGTLVAGLRLLTIDGKSADQVAARHRLNSQDELPPFQTLDGRDLRLAQLNLTILPGGRPLTAADEGTNNVVAPQALAQPLGLHPGSLLTYRLLFGGTFTLRVVGIMDPNSLTPSFGGGLIGSASYLRRYTQGSLTSRSVDYMQFTNATADAAASALNRDLPQVYAFNIIALVPLIDRILERATVFPLVLAALSLFAGAVIIANTVALAVLERRREIGVMKALGARSRTILQLLLLESGLVGLLGGSIGMAMAIIASAVLDAEVLNISSSFDPLVIGGLILLAVALALLASILSALPASREKPLIVLRYE
jgi:predicted lysophospholipase L1 biosynthesis ABC-type transport system permease subunit